MIRSQFATSKGAIKKIAIVVVYGPDTQRFIHLQSLCGARQRPMHSPDKCVQGVMLPPDVDLLGNLDRIVDKDGISINVADMIEDGRRLRGGE